jgi:hypothetical protein
MRFKSDQVHDPGRLCLLAYANVSRLQAPEPVRTSWLTKPLVIPIPIFQPLHPYKAMCIRIGSAGDFQGSCKNGFLIMELVNTIWVFLDEVSIPSPILCIMGMGCIVSVNRQQ